jgi:hypothetical protein
MAELTLPFLEREFLDKHLELADFATQTEAIVSLDTKERDQVLAHLRKDLLEACYCAAHYVNSDDPYQKTRGEIRTFDEDRAMRAKSVSQLKRFFKSHPHFALEFGVRWVLGLKDYGISVSGKKMPEDYLITILSSLESTFALDSLGVSVKSSGRIHNRAHGCILFNRQIGKGQVPSPETMLAFNLVLVTRKASCGECVEQMAESMPQVGNSHYPFVTRLINAALATELDEADVKSRLLAFLDRNDGARYCGWPSRIG